MRLFRLWKLTSRDIGLLWFSLRHPSRPPWLIPAAIIFAMYAMEPFNFAFPLLGIVDDLVLLPLLLHWVLKLLPSEIRIAFSDGPAAVRAA